jgi:hypothetical protein
LYFRYWVCWIPALSVENDSGTRSKWNKKQEHIKSIYYKQAGKYISDVAKITVSNFLTVIISP